MCFGRNIKCVAAWMLAFVLAQGMIYRWGYDRGYLYGSREGYGDFFQEQRTKAHSEAAFRTDATLAPAESDVLIATRQSPVP